MPAVDKKCQGIESRCGLKVESANALDSVRRIFFKGTRVSQLFLSAHATSHLLWRATIVSPLTVLANSVRPLNGVTRSAESLH